jgi:hypothetical protein
LINDGLNKGAFAQEQMVCEGHDDFVHVLAQLGDESQPLAKKELLSERCRDVAFVAEKPSEEATNQAWNGLPIAGIAGSKAEGEQFSTIISDAPTKEEGAQDGETTAARG